MSETQRIDPRCHSCRDVHADRSTMRQMKIVRRDNRSARGIRSDMLWFCKEKGCGGMYQMSLEG